MKTSIEWLIEQLVEMDKQLDGRRKNEDATVLKMNPTKIFEQAKEMHKQEIIVARQDGFNRCFRKGDRKEVSNEQYYQDTFKKD
jgi:hypothetical protein